MTHFITVRVAFTLIAVSAFASTSLAGGTRDHRGSSSNEGGVSVTNTQAPDHGRMCGIDIACGGGGQLFGIRDHRVRDHRFANNEEGGVTVTDTPSPDHGRRCGIDIACGGGGQLFGTRDHRH
jgi:hypothetical protein